MSNDEENREMQKHSIFEDICMEMVWVLQKIIKARMCY